MSENAPKNNKEDIWWRPALLLFAQMSGWIGVPVIIALFLGRWLDDRYGTEPWLFISSTAVAFVISVIGILHEAKKAMKIMDAQDSKASGESNDNGNNEHTQ